MPRGSICPMPGAEALNGVSWSERGEHTSRADPHPCIAGKATGVINLVESTLKERKIVILCAGDGRAESPCNTRTRRVQATLLTPHANAYLQGPKHRKKQLE